MKKLLPLLAILLVVGCNEIVDVRTRSISKTYMVVEGFVTDAPGIQQKVKLSLAKPYFKDGEYEVVSDASVKVNGVIFAENAEKPGEYLAPADFVPTPGEEYELDVNAIVDGKVRTATSKVTMTEPHFHLDKIDYAYCKSALLQLDSTWNVLVWGKDDPGEDYLYLTYKLNDAEFPMDRSLFWTDRYFDGQTVSAFPTSYLMQKAAGVKKYGPCAKFFETGDVLTAYVYTLSQDYYGFLAAVQGSLMSNPMFSSQPANAPCNIEGEDVLGYFSAAGSSSASVVVDDPLRTKHK